jgi:hypothetical protein
MIVNLRTKKDLIGECDYVRRRTLCKANAALTSFARRKNQKKEKDEIGNLKYEGTAAAQRSAFIFQVSYLILFLLVN